MAIGVRIEPELEQQLDQLARSMGKSRSACVREAIAQYVQRFDVTPFAAPIFMRVSGLIRPPSIAG